MEERYEAGQASLRGGEERDPGDHVQAQDGAASVREYLTRLRQDAFLEIKDGYVDSGAAPGKDTRWQRRGAS